MRVLFFACVAGLGLAGCATVPAQQAGANPPRWGEALQILGAGLRDLDPPPPASVTCRTTYTQGGTVARPEIIGAITTC